MAQPTGSTFIGEVATSTKDRISLPTQGIRKLGWAPGDRLLVQRLNEDMVLLMRRPKKSTEQISEESYEEPTDADDEAGALYGVSGATLDPPEAVTPDSPAEEEPLRNGQPMAGDTASATALLERLEQRIAALEQLLANEPASAEAAAPAEQQPETMTADEDLGPEAAGPMEPPGDSIAEDEAASVQAPGAEESEIGDGVEEEQPAGEFESAFPGSAEAEADDAAVDEPGAEEPQAVEAQAGDGNADEAEAMNTGVEETESREVAQPGQEPQVVAAAPEDPGTRPDGQSAESDAVGAGVGAAAEATAGVEVGSVPGDTAGAGAGSATGDTSGVDAGSATGVGAGLQAGVALRIFGDLLRQVVPEEAVGQAMGHLEAGRREGLLALRTLLAAGVERIDAMKDVGGAATDATDKG
jgi:hypothetical protein